MILQFVLLCNKLRKKPSQNAMALRGEGAPTVRSYDSPTASGIAYGSDICYAS